MLCRILVQRGIETFEEAKRFFRPQLDHAARSLADEGHGKSRRRIIQAIATDEKILVFGDYDVDGTTSVACMYSVPAKSYAIPITLNFISRTVIAKDMAFLKQESILPDENEFTLDHFARLRHKVG